MRWRKGEENHDHARHGNHNREHVVRHLSGLRGFSAIIVVLTHQLAGRSVGWFITYVMALGAFAAQKPAPQSGPLTLEDCVRLAESAPSSVVAARLQLEIARYGITQARAGIFPQATLSNAFTYNSRGSGNDPFSFIALNAVREHQSFLTAG